MWSHSVTCHPTRPALTPAVQAGTRFTYPGGMEGWVDLGFGYIPNWFTCPQTITRPGANHLIATRPGVEPTPRDHKSNVLTVTLLSHTSSVGFNNRILHWISEYAVRTYTTADSAVSYLNYEQIAWTTPSFALWRMTAAESCENSTTSASWVWFNFGWCNGRALTKWALWMFSGWLWGLGCAVHFSSAEPRSNIIFAHF